MAALTPFAATMAAPTHFATTPSAPTPFVDTMAILKPFADMPATLTPFAAIPQALTPFATTPTTLKPFAATTTAPTPFADMPATLTSFATTPATLTPFAVTPATLTPFAATPATLKPFAATPAAPTPFAATTATPTPIAATPEAMGAVSCHVIKCRIISGRSDCGATISYARWAKRLPGISVLSKVRPGHGTLPATHACASVHAGAFSTSHMAYALWRGQTRIGSPAALQHSAVRMPHCVIRAQALASDFAGASKPAHCSMSLFAIN